MKLELRASVKGGCEKEMLEIWGCLRCKEKDPRNDNSLILRPKNGRRRRSRASGIGFCFLHVHRLNICIPKWTNNYLCSMFASNARPPRQKTQSLDCSAALWRGGQQRSIDHNDNLLLLHYHHHTLAFIQSIIHHEPSSKNSNLDLAGADPVLLRILPSGKRRCWLAAVVDGYFHLCIPFDF